MFVQATAGVNPGEVVDTIAQWSAVRVLQMGYSRLHVYNSTHLFHEFLSQVTRQREDGYWIIKSRYA